MIENADGTYSKDSEEYQQKLAENNAIRDSEIQRIENYYKEIKDEKKSYIVFKVIMMLLIII